MKAVAVYERPFWRDAGLAGAATSCRGPFRGFHETIPAPTADRLLFGFAYSARLHWASTETAGVSAGHIEAAIRAGLRVADRVTATLAHEPTAR